jgi:hypothetical protein
MDATLTNLEVLDGRYGDSFARHLVVTDLRAMSDTELQFYIPQIVQSLKYDIHDLSTGALTSPALIGIPLYWAMVVEASYVGPHQARYKLLVDVYLRHCGAVQQQVLKDQDTMWGQNGLFVKVCEAVKRFHGGNRTQFLREELTKLLPLLPHNTALPYDPRVRLGELVVDSCKVMSSAKKPLWLVFKNGDAGSESVIVMFKAGDDLRQDCVTLQLIRVMDKIWRERGLDFRLTPYRCAATWPMGGLVEIVKNSRTIADIQMMHGGKLGALMQDSILQWVLKVSCAV